MQTKAVINKEWAFSGRDGAGLREEHGEDWCVAILQDGSTDAAATDSSYTILHGEIDTIVHPMCSRRNYVTFEAMPSECSTTPESQRYGGIHVGRGQDSGGSCWFKVSHRAMYECSN
jgi:hypothetical protein